MSYQPLSIEEQDILQISIWANVDKSQRKAKYLGIIIGPEATFADSFIPVYNKFEERLRRWHKQPLSLFYKIFIYNIYLHSLFSYIIRFGFMNDQQITLISNKLLSFIGPPAHWIPLSILLHLKSLSLFPLAPRSILIDNLAALYRVNLKIHANLTPIILNSRVNNPANSLYHHQLQAQQWMQEESIIIPPLPTPLHPTYSIQAHAYSHILQHLFLFYHNSEITLLNKLQRFNTPPQTINAFLELIHLIISKALKLKTIAPAMIATYLRLICNGWFTLRRFQSIGPCLFCSQLEDSIEHLQHCT